MEAPIFYLRLSSDSLWLSAANMSSGPRLFSGINKKAQDLLTRKNLTDQKPPVSTSSVKEVNAVKVSLKRSAENDAKGTNLESNTRSTSGAKSQMTDVKRQKKTNDGLNDKGLQINGRSHTSALASENVAAANCKLETDIEKPLSGGQSDLLNSKKRPCAFCHSSNQTEGSGPLVCYAHGKEVEGNVANFSKITSDVYNRRAPKIYFKDGIIQNLESELVRANKLKCSSCGKKGAGLGCYSESCHRSYHVPCAFDIPDCRWRYLFNVVSKACKIEISELGYDYDPRESSDEDEVLEDLVDLEELVSVPATTSDFVELHDSEDSGEPTEPIESDDSDRASLHSDATVESPLVITRHGEIIRSMHDPAPEPSHRIYRHPGGVRWMHTPRKRVVPSSFIDRFLIPRSTPAAVVPPLPCRPQWAQQLFRWSCDDHVLPPFGLGQQEFTLETLADRSLPILTGRVVRAETAIQGLVPDIAGIRHAAATAEAQAIMAAFRERERDARIESLSDELRDARRETAVLRRDFIFRGSRVDRLERLVVEILRGQQDASHQQPPQP
ncbi:hypothetical protein OROHE_021446 [Orobanche hederae]